MNARTLLSVALVAGCSLFSTALFATTRYWTGAGADAKASTAANWLSDKGDPSSTGAPEAGDAVVFDAAGEGKACSWDLNVALGSWTQDGYTSTVTIETVFDETGFATLTITGDVNLQSGAWTHLKNPNDDTKKDPGNGETYRLSVSCGGNFTVGANAKVTASCQGFTFGGWGRPVSYKGRMGPAHGGRGMEQYGAKTICYGSAVEPVRIGSGNGCPAGGAVRIIVGKTMKIDGSVEADGRKKTSTGAIDNYYSGSGGSVWLTADKFEGAGLVSADAGWNTHDSYHGGGGRVSLVQTGSAADLSGFTGSLTAYGSRRETAGTPYSGAGTVYYEVADDVHGKGTLIVDAANANLAVSATVTDIYLADEIEGFAPKKMIARNKARIIVDATGVESETALALPIGFAPDASSTIEIVGVSDLNLSGASFSRDGASGVGKVIFTSARKVTMADTLAYENARVQFFDGCTVKGGSLTVGGDGGLDTRGGVTLDVNSIVFKDTSVSTMDDATTVSGNVTIKSGAKLTHTANADTELYKLDLAVGGNLTIEVGGAVDVSAKGYGFKCGPGSDLTKYVGAAHGGRSYQTSTTMGAGVCYGSIVHPFSLGSSISQVACCGGGAAKLTVAGTFTLDGSVLAYGHQGDIYYNTSGGSIWITAAKLVGTSSSALISANASLRTNSYNYNLSGGGRVAVHLTDPTATFDSYAGTITAYGTKRKPTPTFYGGAGTVYLRKGNEAENGGTLIVDNGLAAGPSTMSGITEISATVLDKEVGSVIVRNGAKLQIAAGERLAVNGDVTIDSTLSTETDGGLAFVGTGTSRIYSDLMLSAFVCQTPGKEIVFADGKTLTIQAGGRFQIEGTTDSAVTLRSATAETSWKLTVDAAAAQSVGQAVVTDCDASAGAQISAVNTKLTRTQNWKNTDIIYGQTVRWTGGAGSSAWLAAGNWDAGRAPLSTDRIVIDPADVAPIVSDDFIMLGLSVSTNATLNLGGRTLTVAGDVMIAGRIVSESVGTISASGSVTCPGGTVAPHKVDLVLAGDGKAKQLFGSGGCVFNSITIRPNAAGVRVTEDVTTSTLTCETDEAFAIEVDPDKTLKVESKLALVGDGAVLTLGSSEVGQTWNVNCLGVKTLSGLNVSDSVSQGGTLRAHASTSGGNNTGWDFAGSTAVWTGAVSSDFHAAGNWSTGVVPGEGDDVVISSGTVVANAAVSVFTLWLKGSAVAELNSGVNVAGTLFVESGTTLRHSANTKDGSKKLAVSVGGDFVLESGASVDVSGRGYPGGRGPSWDVSTSGGTYGGRGIATAEAQSANKTYGSILWPTDLGAGGQDGTGGGSAVFTVAGLARIDGNVLAKGSYSQYYAGAGGSVALKTRELIGGGTLAADGGDSSAANYYFGGGGRVAVVLTGAGIDFTRFSGSIHAWSGCIPTEIPQIPYGSPGTVYLETAADGAGCGTVTIDNSAVCYTGPTTTRPLVDYPVVRYTPDVKECKSAKFVLKSYFNLNLVTNAVMGNLEVQGDNVKIYLNGFTLKVRSYRPADWPKDGTLPSYVIPGGTAENPGKVRWKEGLAIIVR